jgi:hypothetical protein
MMDRRRDDRRKSEHFPLIGTNTYNNSPSKESSSRWNEPVIDILCLFTLESSRESMNELMNCQLKNVVELSQC